LGGTCLNVGCIPSKALLDSSHRYEEAVHEFENHGIQISGGVSFDFRKMIERKQSVVDQTVKGIEYLMDKNQIEVIRGLGSFKDSKTLQVSGDEGTIEVTASKFIIADRF
jgi:dihydrolipoamide dehydrogenase